MYQVYGDQLSGNCYKVKLLLHLLDIGYQWHHIDILAGESEKDTFLDMNPNGKVPVLKIREGEYLWESNAILNYLAYNTRFLPSNPLAQARVLQWQFFEQYSHEPYIAVARFINKYLGLPKEREAEYLARQQGGHKALAIMEQRLQHSSFLVNQSFSIADISLYAYTHVAHEGGFNLATYPAIQAWIDTISTLPGYVSMTDQA